MSDTLVSVWQRARDELKAAGVESPVFDARLLLEAGAGVARLDIVTDPRRELRPEQVAAVDALIARRAAREPVAQILGRKAFWTLDFEVSSAVLTPRPETELLIDLALQELPYDQPRRVLDLGVGSGAILLTVLNERPLARGIGVDASSDALAVAHANAATLKLDARADLHHGDWQTPFAERFDLVLSNPPYIPSAAIAGLAPEVVRYEPLMALDGGADGLDAYRAIIPRLRALLFPGGTYGLEIGQGQGEAVADLIGQAGLTPEPPRHDIAGIARVIWGRTPK